MSGDIIIIFPQQNEMELSKQVKGTNLDQHVKMHSLTEFLFLLHWPFVSVDKYVTM